MKEISDNRIYLFIVILSIALVLTAASLYAFMAGGGKSSVSQKEDHTLSVSGSASTFVIPDTASLSIGVQTQGKDASEASEKNAVLMNAVISALKNLGLADKEIRTTFLSVQPVYNYSRDGITQGIVGYTASNNVQVTTQMLDKLGDIVDKSVNSGANQVSGISFMVSEEKQKQARDDLLVNAVKDAGDKAKKLAESLNVRIVSVKATSISEGGFPQPLFQMSAVAEKAATPVLPGESTVTLSVQVEYIIE